MADISSLGNLQSAEPLDMETYPQARAFELPKAGRYTLQAPDTFSFGTTKSNYLSAQIDPKIVGGSHEGFGLRFVKVSAKTWEQDGKPVSQIGNYLKATGYSGVIPADPQGQADAVETTAGRTYDAILDWRVYNSRTGFQVEGMTKFPTDGNGGHLSWVEDPQEKDAEGKPLRLRANLYIRRFLAAAE